MIKLIAVTTASMALCVGMTSCKSTNSRLADAEATMPTLGNADDGTVTLPQFPGGRFLEIGKQQVAYITLTGASMHSDKYKDLSSFNVMRSSYDATVDWAPSASGAGGVFLPLGVGVSVPKLNQMDDTRIPLDIEVGSDAQDVTLRTRMTLPDDDHVTLSDVMSVTISDCQTGSAVERATDDYTLELQYGCAAATLYEIVELNGKPYNGIGTGIHRSKPTLVVWD